MIQFLEMQGPFVVTFRGEVAGCWIKETAKEVLWFLMGEHGAGFKLNNSERDVLSWLNDADNWTRDDSGRPFEWQFSVGEMSDVAVTRITVA